MKKKCIVFMQISFFILSSHFIASMEKKIVPTRQRKVIIPCNDGICALEKWKIVQSISLYKHCLAYDQNFLSKDIAVKMPKFFIEQEKIELFSKSLDIPPGKPFEHYFKSLTLAQKQMLITVAGENQLNMPAFTAQLADVYFDKSFHDRHIKPLLERWEWSRYCRNAAVKNNITSPLVPNISGTETSYLKLFANGYLGVMPLCLMEEGARYDEFDYVSITRLINNVQRKVWCYKDIDGNWEHCITPAEIMVGFQKEVSPKEILLWAINKDKNYIAKTVIRHTSKIIQFFFSNNGEYVITQSKSDVFVTRIIHKEDGSCAFSTCLVDHNNRIMDVYCNNESNRLITCSASEVSEGSIKLFDLSGKCIAHFSNFGFTHDITVSPDESKILVSALFFNQIVRSNVIICVMQKDRIVPYMIIPIPEQNLYESNIISNVNGDYWAIIQKGGLSLISTYGVEYTIHTLIERSRIKPNNDIKILFSSDSKFLIALVQKNSEEFLFCIWSTTSGKLVTSQYFHMDNIVRCNIGLTPKDREIVLFVAQTVYKMPFIDAATDYILDYLLNLTSVHELIVLRRLYVAYKNKDSIKLYKEEPAYKALCNMPSIRFNIVNFIQTYLPWKKIKNKKNTWKLLQNKVQKILPF